MPAYPGNDLATLLYENKQAFFYQNEAVVAGTLSRAFELRRTRGDYYPWGFSVEVAFGGAPGTFEIDILAADTDNMANYVVIGQIVTVNGSYVGRFEGVGYWPKYVAIQHVTFPNAVNTTAMVTR
jgi:hypothetical protein